MKQIAIIGGGPTALYTLEALLSSEPLISVTLFEKGAEIGSGMPYGSDTTTPSMLSNIAGFEIPPVLVPLKDWLLTLDTRSLKSMGLEDVPIDDRSYYGRRVLGQYFQAQLSALVAKGRLRGHDVLLRRRTEAKDVIIKPKGVEVHWESPEGEGSGRFDEVVLATGHSWTRTASGKASGSDLVPLWPLKDVASLTGDTIGIFGTSLSGIDATVALAERDGTFSDDDSEWTPRAGLKPPKIVMMSRKGLLPEADYYYPYPLPELAHLTRDKVQAECELGQIGLLQRIFDIFLDDLQDIAPDRVSDGTAIEDFIAGYFEKRLSMPTFDYARANLIEAQKGHQRGEACPWRVSILRAHEMFELAAPYLNAADLDVLKAELGPVFADNYASVPHRSIKRLIALHNAGILSVVALGEDYGMNKGPTTITISNGTFDQTFDAIIDARGQMAMGVDDLGFAGLKAGETVNELGQGAGFHLTPLVPTTGFIQCVSLPILLTRRPFVQGLESCAKLGAAAGHSIVERVQPIKAA